MVNNIGDRFNNFCDGYFTVSLNAKSIGKAVVKGTVGIPVSLIVALRNVAVGSKKLCNWTWSKLTNKNMNNKLANTFNHAEETARQQGAKRVSDLIKQHHLDKRAAQLNADGIVKSMAPVCITGKTVVVGSGQGDIKAVVTHPRPTKKNWF